MPEVEIREVSARPLAVVRTKTEWPQLSRTIQTSIDAVYAFIAEAPVAQSGHNVVVYLDDTPTIEVGFEVDGTFEASQGVTPSATPAGRAATITHHGPYTALSQTHQAVRAWASENGHSLAGPRWEIYGDWHDDPAQLETQVFHLLA